MRKKSFQTFTMWGLSALVLVSSVLQLAASARQPPMSSVLVSGSLSVRYSATNPQAWSVGVAGAPWLQSLDEAITVARGGGAVATLVPAGPGGQIAGSDILGKFIKVQTNWSLKGEDQGEGAVPRQRSASKTASPVLVTSIRVYTAAAAPNGLVVFAQDWPRGWNQTGPAGSASDVIAAFPSFVTTPSASDGPPPPPLNFLSFGGCQLANTFGGRWTGAASVPGGERLGIPLVLYGRAGPAVALSPATNWMTAVQ